MSRAVYLIIDSLDDRDYVVLDVGMAVIDSLAVTENRINLLIYNLQQVISQSNIEY
jgi:hypothetical protein